MEDINAVNDPEIPVLPSLELGIVREIKIEDETVEVNHTHL